ncbi:MAG: archease [Acidobacteriia bacterium]|nr:archease [Terriglobia bacterium]
MKGFEEIDHTADRAFRVTGRDMVALLKNATRAMQALDGLPPPTEASATREIEVEGIDRETLLVNWLNEILFLEQAHRLVCTDFQIFECKNHHVRGRVETSEAEHRLTHIKAVTFHNLTVREIPEGLEAEIVVDV